MNIIISRSFKYIIPKMINNPYLTYRPNLPNNIFIGNIHTFYRYSKNMKTLSTIFKDRPLSAMDTAIYWIEYVIRHKGAYHLRSPAADMHFYEYLLLDVILFVIFIIFSLTIVIYLVLQKCYSTIRPRFNDSKKEVWRRVFSKHLYVDVDERCTFSAGIVHWSMCDKEWSFVDDAHHFPNVLHVFAIEHKTLQECTFELIISPPTTYIFTYSIRLLRVLMIFFEHRKYCG